MGRGEEDPGPGPSSQPGAQSTAGCAPSFLRTPLCHHGKPPRGPVHSRSAPGRQGLLGGLGSGQKDAGQAWGGHMPLAQWGPRGQGSSQVVKGQRSKRGCPCFREPPRISAVEAGFDPLVERGCRPEIGAGGPSGRRACGEHPGAGAGAGLGAAIGAGFLGFHPDSPSALPADSVLLGDHVTRAAFDPSLGAGRGRGREGVSDAGPTRARGGCRESRRR